MINTRISAMLLLSIIALSNLAVVSQDDSLRKANYIDTLMLGDPFLRVPPNSTSNNCVLEWKPTIDSVPVTLVMPFQRPGDTTVEGGEGFSEILISGWKTDNTGVICRISLDYASLEIHLIETREYPGVDPLDLAFTGSRLFVLDLAGARVITAPLVELGSLPSIQDFETAYSFSSTPYESRLAPIQAASGLILPDSCQVYSVFASAHANYIAPAVAGGWLLFDPNASNEEVPYDGPYHVTNSSSVSSKGPVFLWGRIGNYSIWNFDSASAVVSGVITNSEVVVSVVPVSDLELGIAHAIVSSTGEGLSSKFYPTVRYGMPMHVPTASFTAGEIFGGRVVQGDGDFTTSVWLGFDDLTTGPVSLPVVVWWNWRDEVTGQDPVIIVGQSAQLVGAAGSRSMQLSVEKNSLGQEMGLEMPIPFDPDLIGRVLLFQWATLAPVTNELVLSDVYGSKIVANPLFSISSPSTTPQNNPLPGASELTVDEIFRAVSRTIDTPEHRLLQATIEASAKLKAESRR